MIPRYGAPGEREAAARRLLERLRARAAVNEAVGVLRSWGACGTQQARDDLCRPGAASQHAEARRVIAAADAAADGRADPDGGWD
ncbi:MAG: hypothetical protein QOI78_8944 [Actinomycetota bacterium]|nr:hypothetical protein [Actinomycetota bacterium]